MKGPRPVTAALNRLLRESPLAMERLRRHAGRTARFDVGPLHLAFRVLPEGDIESATADAARDLTVRISPFALPRLAARDESAFREVQFEGDADLAQDVAFLARHLRWEVEEDLSRLTGDIIAHRVVGAARAVSQGSRDAAARAVAGAAEYWTEESPLIASRVKVEDFIRDVDGLRDDVERLAKRLAALSPGARDSGL